MARTVGFEEPARYAPPRAGELRRSALDPGRAAIHLAWKPWTTIDDGAPRTIDWFRAQRVGR
jgi:UDP-glucose 4-epimerase